MGHRLQVRHASLTLTRAPIFGAATRECVRVCMNVVRVCVRVCVCVCVMTRAACVLTVC